MFTSLTTVAGLLPILLEKSFQAQFLIPMAISISFGLMGATLLVLVLVPALYMLLYDVRQICRWLWHGTWQLPEERVTEEREVEMATRATADPLDPLHSQSVSDT